MKKSVTILAVTGFIFLKTFVTAQSYKTEIRKDIIYKKVDGRELKLDIGRPNGKGPFPAIVFFHGGGWQQGNKSHMHKWMGTVAEAGFIGVSVQYSFAPEYKWPSQVEDAKEAIRWVRAHAKELGIDQTSIGVMGESAGGYLALMVGLTSSNDGLEGITRFANVSSSVQAVVSYFSATDFTARRKELSPELKEEMLRYYGKTLEQVRADFTGTTNPMDPILKKMSVLSYVDNSDPPVLIFHGDNDPFVSVEHAIKLRDELKKAKVPHTLVVVDGGGHGWTGEHQEKTTRQMMEFFAEKLMKSNR